MAQLHLDCSSGMAGSMLVGLCLDLGVSFDKFSGFIHSLGLSDYEVIYEKVKKRGISSSYFDIKLIKSEEIKTRFLPEIIEIIGKCEATDQVKNRACNVFHRLAVAEATVHGVGVDEVHFHEVGAVDAIIDILGACWCMEELKVTTVTADSLKTGRGWVKCAHGLMPIPAPATAELLLGIPYQQGEVDKELLTPTGAALLAEWVDVWGERPVEFQAEKIGYGAGKWELENPNVVRGYLGAEPIAEEILWMMETQLDDSNPQFFPELKESLLKLGCADVWTTSIQMKKGRSGVLLSVLVTEPVRQMAEAMIFTQIPTLGIRRWKVERTILMRTFKTVEVLGKVIRIKQGWLDGKIVNQMPEWEDCLQASKELGVAPREIWVMSIQGI